MQQSVMKHLLYACVVPGSWETTVTKSVKALCLPSMSPSREEG